MKNVVIPVETEIQKRSNVIIRGSMFSVTFMLAGFPLLLE
jgi:hypothetical protein